MSPSGSVTRCDSCGQEKVTTEQNGRRLCLTCLRRADAAAPASAAASPSPSPSPLSGFIGRPSKGEETREDDRRPERPRRAAPSGPPGGSTYRRRRTRRGRKWLILGAIVLCVGGALLAIALTQGASGLVRLFRGFPGR